MRYAYNEQVSNLIEYLAMHGACTEGELADQGLCPIVINKAIIYGEVVRVDFVRYNQPTISFYKLA